MEHRPSVAIIVPGGIGNIDNIPSLLDLIEHLSRSFNIIIYSFADLHPHPILAQSNCKVSFLPKMITALSSQKHL